MGRPWGGRATILGRASRGAGCAVLRARPARLEEHCFSVEGRRSHWNWCELPRSPCRILRVHSGEWPAPSGDWRRGSALPSHGRGHWFDPSIAHGRISGSGHADVAQLVEHHLAKVRVAGSNPVVRSGSGASDDRRERLFHWCGTSRWVGRVVRQRPAKPCTRVRIPYPPPSQAPGHAARAIGAAVARFPDTEEVTGSIPVSPTAGSQDPVMRT